MSIPQITINIHDSGVLTGDLASLVFGVDSVGESTEGSMDGAGVSPLLPRVHLRRKSNEALTEDRTEIGPSKLGTKRRKLERSQDLTNYELFQWKNEQLFLIYSSYNPPETQLDTETAAVLLNFERVDEYFRSIWGGCPVDTARDQVTPLMRGHLYEPHAKHKIFWSEEDKAVHMGAVDSESLNSFATNFDLNVYAWSHPKITSIVRFGGECQSRGLLHSLCAVSAICAKQRLLGMKDPIQANWFLGEVFRNSSDQKALLAFDKQSTVSDQHDLPLEKTHFGFSINSGVLNHAFYLVATKLKKPSWELPLKIWQIALSTCSSNDTFAIFANRTVAAAKALLLKKRQIKRVEDAWKEVGVMKSRK